MMGENRLAFGSNFTTSAILKLNNGNGSRTPPLAHDITQNNNFPNNNAFVYSATRTGIVTLRASMPTVYVCAGLIRTDKRVPI